MNNCPKCGMMVTEKEQKFCAGCGANLEDYEKNFNTSFNRTMYNTETPSNDNISCNNMYSMRWYKFLIYFGLIFAAIICLLVSIAFISGSIYETQSGGSVTAEQIYGLFGTSLKAVDVMYGLCMLGSGVWALVTRVKLAQFKKEAPKFLYAYYAIGFVASLLYNIICSSITGTSIMSEEIIRTVLSAFVVILTNYKYFTKRKSLFVN